MEQDGFSARLRHAMDEAGLKQADLVRMASQRGEKLGKSQLSQYVSGKVRPRQDSLALLADLLGVTADWLEGRPEAREQAKPHVQVRNERERPMREFKKSSKLDHVLYDVRGPVVDEAARMEAEGERILKLNIGNPAPFGFRTPDEVVKDMRQQLTECEGYSNSRGLFSARKAIMQYAQLKGLPNVQMEHIYTGNGVSELIQLSMHALLDDGDEILIPSPD